MAPNYPANLLIGLQQSRLHRQDNTLFAVIIMLYYYYSDAEDMIHSRLVSAVNHFFFLSTSKGLI